jgi:hypothetical protein
VWFDASSAGSLTRGFEALAARMDASRLFDNTAAKVAFVKESLVRQPTPWLMVLDNFDEPGDFADVTSFFPQASRGAILITKSTRRFESSRRYCSRYSNGGR